MISRDDLALHLSAYLECSKVQDYAPNGLQVEGRATIKHICTAVTASAEVIDAAIAAKADALIVHHGYFWKGESAVITGMKRARLAKILSYDLNLYAYHLPLDTHSILGNNAQLGHLLGLEKIRAMPVSNVANLLWFGEFQTALSPDALNALISQKLNRQALHIGGNQPLIKNVSWCSGGAQNYLIDAKLQAADAYISGEVSERTYYEAKELDIHYYAAGHHATERLGVQALGEYLAQTFNLSHSFLDTNNPI